jgi:hypothetical protein
MKTSSCLRAVGWLNVSLSLAVLLVLSLAGCVTAPSALPQVQYVPIAPAQIPLPGRPHLAVQDLAPTSDAPAVIKAFTASLPQCTGYLRNYKRRLLEQICTK